MNSQNTNGASTRLDPLPYIERLSALATAVFAEHVSVAHHCTVCCSTWPCEQVRLAEHNLAVV